MIEFKKNNIEITRPIEIVHYVKTKREAIGLSQTTLSLISKVDRSWLNRFENYKIDNPNFEMVMKLLEALQIKMAINT